jgi:hypothetical protein
MNSEKTHFFIQNLLNDVRILEKMIAKGQFQDSKPTLGAEQELCIVDDYGNVLPSNMEILKELNHPQFTTELAKFNLEINTTPKSIEKTHSYGGVWSGDFSKGNVTGVLHSDFNKRKTYGGKKLKESYIYHGKIISKNLSKPKSCYFQNEKGIFSTIKELKGIDLTKSKNPLKEVKNQLIPSYKDYIMTLMREMGMKKFEDHKVKFTDFIEWYKKK